MRIWSRVLAFLVVALAAFWFTVANASERVTLDLVLFRVTTSLPLVFFGAMLIGMLVMIIVGLRADLQTRRSLQHLRGVAGGPPPRSAPSTQVPPPSAQAPSHPSPSTRGPDAIE